MQLSYSSFRRKGMIGQKSDSSPSNVVSKLSRPIDRIPFGTLVVWDGNNTCRPPAAKEDIEQSALGVALLDGCGDSYKPSATVSALREGRIFVEAQSDVEKPGAEVFVHFEGALAGTFAAMEGPGTMKLKGACFLQTARKGDVAELEISLLGSSK